MQEMLRREEMATWLAFLTTHQIIEVNLDGELREQFNLSHSEFEILVKLEGAEGGRLRMGELARNLVSNKSALTYKISRLVDLGLVERIKCPSDARGLFATLTPKGRELLTRALPVHAEVLRSWFIDLLTPMELEQLRELTSSLYLRMTARVGSEQLFPDLQSQLDTCPSAAGVAFESNVEAAN